MVDECGLLRLQNRILLKDLELRDAALRRLQRSQLNVAFWFFLFGAVFGAALTWALMEIIVK